MQLKIRSNGLTDEEQRLAVISNRPMGRLEHHVLLSGNHLDRKTLYLEIETPVGSAERTADHTIV
jgi:hypothetical protein